MVLLIAQSTISPQDRRFDPRFRRAGYELTRTERIFIADAPLGCTPTRRVAPADLMHWPTVALLDVIVIGSGITGVGICLRCLATRGLTVALVEKHDLAFGAVAGLEVGARRSLSGQRQQWASPGAAPSNAESLMTLLLVSCMPCRNWSRCCRRWVTPSGRWCVPVSWPATLQVLAGTPAATLPRSRRIHLGGGGTPTPFGGTASTMVCSRTTGN